MKFTTETKLFIGIIAFSIAIIVGAVFYFSKPEPTFTREELIPKDAHVYGNASASAFLVEFSDFQCPACKGYQSILKQILDEYKDKLTFVYRHFPLDQHNQAMNAAIAAEAASKQDKFWEMHDGIFAEDQEAFTPETFTKVATTLKLDMDQYAKDLKDPALQAIVEADKAAGNKFGVAATPTFYLNGKKLDIVRPQDLSDAVKAAVK